MMNNNHKSATFFEIISEIKSDIEKNRVDSFILKTLPKLKDNAVSKYFYTTLVTADMLPYLTNENVFNNPPSMEKDEINDTIYYPIWPESQYLVRMAPKAPETVMKVILDIPETDNERIHMDMVDAALAALENSPDLVEDWAKKELEWMRQRERLYILLPDKLATLMARLAQAGKQALALALATVLLEVRSDPEEDLKLKEETGHMFLDPRPKFDAWHYEQILKEHLPVLTEVEPAATLSIVCTNLMNYIRYKRGRSRKRQHDDFSVIWRPAIEENTQNSHPGFSHTLVDGVRDCAIQLVQENLIPIKEVVAFLNNQSSLTLKRIVFHVLAEFPDMDIDLLAVKLVDEDVFFEVDLDHYLKHEYARLMSTGFVHLSKVQQKQIFTWIEGGPRYDDDEDTGAPEDNSDRDEQRANIWRRNCLHRIKDDLPDEWRKKYKALIREFGPPGESNDYVFHMTTSWGPKSPKSRDELSQMSIQEIIDYLHGYHEKPDIQPLKEDESVEGLAREIRAVVEENPVPFAGVADQFIAMEPSYVCNFLEGLRTAVTNKTNIPWDRVLALVKWVIEQPVDSKGRKDYRSSHADPDFTWCKKAGVDLLNLGLRFDEGLQQHNDEETIVECLIALAREQDPMIAQEENGQIDGWDSITLALNSTRGQAIEALIRLAVQKEEKVRTESGKETPSSMTGISFLNKILEFILYNADPSKVYFSILGEWLPSLYWLDSAWTKTHINDIFPKPQVALPYREAAWHAYLASNQPQDKIYELLNTEYRWAVERIGENEGVEDLPINPERQLTEHLLILYVYGKTDLVDKDALLSRFYERASDELKAHLMHSASSNLYRAEGIMEGILPRLKELWEHRLAIVKEQPVEERNVAELRPFGYWILSNEFPMAWKLGQFKEALSLCGKTESDHAVVKKFVEIVDEFPLEVVECLNLMVKGDLQGWEIHVWKEELKIILGKVYRSDKQEASDLAYNLINYLGFQGFHEFGELLG